MSLHPLTFEYLKPTDEQISHMDTVRTGFAALASLLDAFVPAGPDKTYVLRQLRECAMWSNAAITRNPDGSPRT